MKAITIRFVEIDNKFYMQRKNIFGCWTDIRYTINMGYGSISERYYNSNKEDLLKEVLEDYYKVDKRFCAITEYPSLKQY